MIANDFESAAMAGSNSSGDSLWITSGVSAVGEPGRQNLPAVCLLHRALDAERPRGGAERNRREREVFKERIKFEAGREGRLRYRPARSLKILALAVEDETVISEDGPRSLRQWSVELSPLVRTHAYQ